MSVAPHPPHPLTRVPASPFDGEGESRARATGVRCSCPPTDAPQRDYFRITPSCTAPPNPPPAEPAAGFPAGWFGTRRYITASFDSWRRSVVAAVLSPATAGAW